VAIVAGVNEIQFSLAL